MIFFNDKPISSRRLDKIPDKNISQITRKKDANDIIFIVNMNSFQNFSE